MKARTLRWNFLGFLPNRCVFHSIFWIYSLRSWSRSWGKLSFTRRRKSIAKTRRLIVPNVSICRRTRSALSLECLLADLPFAQRKLKWSLGGSKLWLRLGKCSTVNDSAAHKSPMKGTEPKKETKPSHVLTKLLRTVLCSSRTAPDAVYPRESSSSHLAFIFINGSKV